MIDNKALKARSKHESNIVEQLNKLNELSDWG
jgi:hypothetical protein